MEKTHESPSRNGNPCCGRGYAGRRTDRSAKRNAQRARGAGATTLLKGPDSTRKMGSAEFGAFIESEMKKWERVVRDGGIKAE